MEKWPNMIPNRLHPGVRGQGPGGLPGHRHRPGQPQHQDQGTRVAYVAGMTGGKLAECGESLILKAGERSSSASSPRSSITWPASRGWRRPPPEPEPRGLSNSRWSWALVLVVIAVF